jgi:hypothetical protein
VKVLDIFIEMLLGIREKSIIQVSNICAQINVRDINIIWKQVPARFAN